MHMEMQEPAGMCRCRQNQKQFLQDKNRKGGERIRTNKISLSYRLIR